MEALVKLDAICKKVSRIFSYAGAFFIVALTVLIALDVVMRYFFNRPMLGAHELCEYMLLLSFFLFLTDCWNVDTHVRMDIVYARTSKGVRRTCDVIIGIVGALLFAGMAWKIFCELVYAVGSHEVSSELHMSIWPFKAVALLCLIVFILQLTLSTVVQHEPLKRH